MLSSTQGVIFMACPHRNSKLASWELLFANLVNATGVEMDLRESLLRHANWDSNMLGEISKQFTQNADKLKLMSFIEQQVEPPLTTLVFYVLHPSTLEGCNLIPLPANTPQVVPQHSAVLNLPNEIILPMNASHTTICRFRSKHDQGYVLVEHAIRELVSAPAGKHGTSVFQFGVAYLTPAVH